jgi:hypothetical protein
MILRRAKVFANVLQEIPIFIEEGTLIVGNGTSKPPLQEGLISICIRSRTVAIGMFVVGILRSIGILWCEWPDAAHISRSLTLRCRMKSSRAPN